MVRPRFSADVKLRLIIGNEVHPLSQVGPDRGILVKPVAMPPSDARIEIILNNKVSSTHQVFIHSGLSADTREFEFF